MVEAAQSDEGQLNVALQQLDHAIGESRPGMQQDVVAHARGVVDILSALGADLPTRLAGILFLGDKRAISIAQLEQHYPPSVVGLVAGVRRVTRMKEIVDTGATADSGKAQAEALRKMMLAMATDVRVVLIRLASRLQTLRHYTLHKAIEPPPLMLAETRDVLAPLANRLGIWQIKWELEDLVFRYLEPELYRELAGQLDEKRREREAYVESMTQTLAQMLKQHQIAGRVYGRPKHLFSIAQKIRNKGKSIDSLRDLRAFRVIVQDVSECYQVLSILQARWLPLANEFDDYIARPKANGYQSLHTVLEDDHGRQFEVQIRTRQMHDFAEHGVAAHWRYKEAASDRKSSKTASAIAQDPTDLRYVRQLLAWQQEVGGRLEGGSFELLDERIYVLTPQAKIVELPNGSTPVDFAYHVHTDLGHRCRGARVDGALVPLHHVLHTGQTVEIISARENERSGPSRDWLNAELGYVQSQRGKQKVRQWFNALELEKDLAAGRATVERAMQREGKTNVPFEDLAKRFGIATVDEFFLNVQKELIGARLLEQALRGEVLGGESEREQALAQERALKEGDVLSLAGHRPAVKSAAPVLVLGADFLLTHLARCCRPVPPDRIAGFVTRGKGISVHRANCAALSRLAQSDAERLLECTWGASDGLKRYPIDCTMICEDRQGLLRDISDVFARNKINVISVSTLSRKDRASMRFTVEVSDLDTFRVTCTQLMQVKGVISAQRR